MLTMRPGLAEVAKHAGKWTTPLASDAECLEERGLEYGLFYLFPCYV